MTRRINRKTMLMLALSVAAVFVLLINTTPAHAADGDLISDSYQGVPYRYTADYELIIGAEGAEYTVNCTDLIRSIPNIDEMKLSVRQVSFAGTLHQEGSCEKLLDGFSALEAVDFTNFETSGATSMRAMFQNCHSLKRLDLSGFDTRNVTNMRYMFNKCRSMRNLDLTGFQTSQVTEMQRMFQACEVLTTLDLSSFDTSRVTNMSNMFQNCNALRSLDISGFDTSAIDTSDTKEGMQHIFSGCKSLQAVALGPKCLLVSPMGISRVDPPTYSWTRMRLLNGTAADDPTIYNLSSYDGKSPGWYVAAYAADDTSNRIACGTDFTDYFGRPSSYYNMALIDPKDPAGTAYTWEKISGEGEIVGGTLTDGTCLSFHAVKAGDITLQLTAASGGKTLRTVTRTYRIVDPTETYRLSSTGMLLYAEEDTVDIGLKTWADDGLCAATEAVPEPAATDFTWTQTGTGEVKGTPSEDGSLSWRFELVRRGRVDLTFTSRDGSWSKTMTLWAQDPNVHATLFMDDEELHAKDNSLKISFALNKSDGEGYAPKAKRGQITYIGDAVTVFSSDESVAVAGTPYWDKPYDWDTYDVAEFTLPLRLVKAGKVSIWILDRSSGEPIECISMSFSEKAVQDYRDNWDRYSSDKTIQYGEKFLPLNNIYSGCDETEGDTVTLNIGGEEQTLTILPGANGFTVPVVKTGTTGTITYVRSCDGYTATRDVTVKDTSVQIGAEKITSKQKKLQLYFYDRKNDSVGGARDGDVIKVKVGSKTFTRKVIDTSKYRYNLKISRQKKGTKIKITVYNKFDQVRFTKTVKVR